MLSEVETSPGRVPLVCNYVIATSNFSRKERFREICSTSLLPLDMTLFTENTIQKLFQTNNLLQILKNEICLS